MYSWVTKQQTSITSDDSSQMFRFIQIKIFGFYWVQKIENFLIEKIKTTS